MTVTCTAGGSNGDDDESLGAYFAKKQHVAQSIDGLPGLPLPLPPLPAPTAGVAGRDPA